MDIRELGNSNPFEAVAILERGGFPPGGVAQLRELAERGIHPLQVLMQQKRQKPESPRPRMLGTFDLEGIAQYMAEREVRRIVVMCGAGVSTSAGIPDFRTPGTGLYDNLQKYQLPEPEAIFSLDYFREKPDAFYELCREMWPGQFDPTPGHYFVRLLHEKGLLLRCYSQNIDSLENQAGIPAEKLVAAHGNFDAAHVIDKEPEVEVDIAEVKDAVTIGREGWMELREKYGGLVKPKIVFFGEGLPGRFGTLSDQDLRKCDLLIVLGTSLVVAPFNGLVGKAARDAPRLLINMEPAGLCEKLEIGFRFHKEGQGENWRDVFHKGDIDAGVRSLAKTLGWAEDLEALVDSKGTAKVSRAPWAAEDAP